MKKYATVQTTFQISIHLDVNSVRKASFNSFSTHIEKLDQIIEGKVGTLSFFMAPKPKKSRGSSSRKGQAKENETDVEANSNSGDSERRYCGNWLSR